MKIRGYRVDPAEIEGVLLAHPRVTGAVVTPHRDDRGAGISSPMSRASWPTPRTRRCAPISPACCRPT
ncbi:hypothetical protein O1M54_47940 [Streptomyces diastatochromogenes]|nr:hypothetical protein [Streptomyces diastatochromogenes]